MNYITARITGVSLFLLAQAASAQTAGRAPVSVRPVRGPRVVTQPARPQPSTTSTATTPAATPTVDPTVTAPVGVAAVTEATQALGPALTTAIPALTTAIPALTTAIPALTTAIPAATPANSPAGTQPAATQTTAIVPADPPATTAPVTTPGAVPLAQPTTPSAISPTWSTQASAPAPADADEPRSFLRLRVGPDLGFNIHPVESMRMYSRSMLAASYGLWVSYDLQKATSVVQIAAEVGYRYEDMSARYASIFTAQMQNHFPYAGATVRYAVRDWFMPYTRATVGAMIGLVQVSGPQSATLNATAPSVGGTLGLGALFQGRVGHVVGLFALVEGGGMAFSNASVTLREDPPADPDIAAERIRTVPVQTGDTNVSGAYVRLAFGLSL